MPSLPDQSLDNALAIYTAALPRQARLLSLAGQVLHLLAGVRAGLLPMLAADPGSAAASMSAGVPVLTTVPLPMDRFEATLGQLLALAVKFELMAPLSPGLFDRLRQLSPRVWLAEPEKLAALCAASEAPQGLLLYLGLKALSPFYQRAAEPFLTLFLGGGWLKAFCPACGQEPVLATLAPEASQRVLYCSLCAAQWPAPRRACVFCGHEDEHFSYLFIEDDPARRADLCPACHRYLKTIITAKMTHLTYLPLEEFITVDLDTLIAQRESSI